jgi:hypothetical protein
MEACAEAIVGESCLVSSAKPSTHHARFSWNAKVRQGRNVRLAIVPRSGRAGFRADQAGRSLPQCRKSRGSSSHELQVKRSPIISITKLRIMLCTSKLLFHKAYAANDHLFATCTAVASIKHDVAWADVGVDLAIAVLLQPLSKAPRGDESVNANPIPPLCSKRTPSSRHTCQDMNSAFDSSVSLFTTLCTLGP